MTVHAEHQGAGSSQAVAHPTREPGPIVNMDVQRSNGNDSITSMQKEVVPNTASTKPPEERLSNLSKVTQTPDILESNLDPLRTRPMIIGPEIYSGYAEVLYAGGSKNPGMEETRGICGFQNSFIVNENRKDVGCMHTSASTNILFDKMKTVDDLCNFENSSPAQIYRTDSADVKPVHVALAQTHLASHSDADKSGKEEPMNIGEIKMDPAAELTTKLEESDSTSIKNVVDQEKQEIPQIQNKQADSSLAGPMLVDPTIQSENSEADYNTTALTSTDGISSFTRTLSPITEGITVESSKVEAVTATPIIAPCQSIETQTSRAKIECVDSSCATSHFENDFPTVDSDHVTTTNVDVDGITQETDVDVDVEAHSEAETVDVETAMDGSATGAWSSAETRGSLESLPLEDMEVDVDVEGEGAGAGAGVEVPDEWCDACRQRLSPAPDITTLSRRYRVAKWLGSLLEFMGLVSGDEPDRASLETLGPPTRSRGFFF